MSEQYTFSDESTLVSHENVVWNEQAATEVQLDYSGTNDNTLTDSISESYVTADEDNATQYLSVLETTNDITLDDLHNITLEHPKNDQGSSNFAAETDENLAASTVDMGDQQVVVFTLDGSDDLYGIQLAQDEDGNIQKYQFKFGTNEEGQLEAIPESIQLLPNDDEIIQAVQDTEDTLEDQTEHEEVPEVRQIKMYVKEDNSHEHILPDDNSTEENETVEEMQEAFEEDTDTQIEGERTEIMEEMEEYEQNEGNVEEENVQFEEDIVDIKTGILEEALKSKCNIKEEIVQEDTQHPQDETSQDHIKYQQVYDNQTTQEYEAEEQLVEHEAIVNFEQYPEDTTVEMTASVDHHINALYKKSNKRAPRKIEPKHYEEIFVEENHILDQGEENLDGSFDQNDSVETDTDDEDDLEEQEEANIPEPSNDVDSENEEYQIVDGLHITGDVDVLDKPTALERTNILKNQHIGKIVEDKGKNTKTLVYYLVQHQEKENSLSMHNSTVYRPIKANPRSILKSSYSIPSKQEDKLTDNRLTKRFARGKEATQARLFQNFISRTTIPQAPVRKEKMPRKQKIKPVNERINEEIIVQEVMVSSKGFVEPLDGGVLKNKDNIQILDYVELSDSDDEYDKQGNKRKKKHKTNNTNDETDGSDESVIEIINSDDELEDNNHAVKKRRGRPRKSIDDSSNKIELSPQKRRRGRPPKTNKSDFGTSRKDSDADSGTESPQKKSRTDTSDENLSDFVKNEIKCPNCPKTFPSQNSLKTHIQHHNLENSLRHTQVKEKVKTSSVKPVSNSQAMEYKYRCSDCENTFKNNILLKKHICTKDCKFECSVCQKKFPDVFKLNIHKRLHIKSQIVKSTTTAKVSPKKPRASTSTFRSPKKISTYKCNDCDKICSSLLNLNIHKNSHKKFKCTNCFATFTSRILLDTHVMENCVKSKSPNNKRLSFKIRKSYVNSPRRTTLSSSRFLTRRSSIAPTNSNTPKENTSLVSLQCSECPLKFTTYTKLFKHKVIKHGQDTPDKSILTTEPKKPLYKQKATHGGMLANDRFRKSYAALRSNLQCQEKTDT